MRDEAINKARSFMSDKALHRTGMLPLHRDETHDGCNTGVLYSYRCFSGIGLCDSRGDRSRCSRWQLD